MDIASDFESQYLASLKMLREVVVKCPNGAWNSPRDKDKTWFTVYHVLYWTHKYLQPTRKDFVRWKGYGKPNAWPGLRGAQAARAPSKGEMLEYLDFVEQQVVERLAAMDFGGPSGFHGFPMDKLEMQLVNLRHLQQHTGELYERLGARANVRLNWSQQVHRSRK